MASSRGGRARHSLFGADPRARRLTEPATGGQATVVWQESETCATCNVKFDIWTRRHHCRHCGKSFCDAHVRSVAASRVSQRDDLLDDLFEETVVLCRGCITDMRHGVRALASPEAEALRRRRRRRRRRATQAGTGSSPHPADEEDMAARARALRHAAAREDEEASSARLDAWLSTSSAGRQLRHGDAASGIKPAVRTGAGTGDGNSDCDGAGRMKRTPAGGEDADDSGLMGGYAARLSALWGGDDSAQALPIESAEASEQSASRFSFFGFGEDAADDTDEPAHAATDAAVTAADDAEADSNGTAGYEAESEGATSHRNTIEDALSSYAGRLSLLWTADAPDDELASSRSDLTSSSGPGFLSSPRPEQGLRNVPAQQGDGDGSGAVGALADDAAGEGDTGSVGGQEPHAATSVGTGGADDETAALRAQLLALQQERDFYREFHAKHQADSGAGAGSGAGDSRGGDAIAIRSELASASAQSSRQLRRMKSMERRHNEALTVSAVKELSHALRRHYDAAKARGGAERECLPTLSFELWSENVAMDTMIGAAALVLPQEPNDLQRRASWFLPINTGGALECGIEHARDAPASLQLQRISGTGTSPVREERWSLCVRVFRARALDNVQTFGEQDPYV
eukprot:g3955.t1